MKRLHVALTAVLMASGSQLPADDGEKRPEERGPGQLFSKLDQDANGVLAKDEVPEGQVRFFERLVRVGDKNDDGQLTKEEFAAAMEQAEPQSDVRPDAPGRPGSGRPPFDGAMFERLDANKDGKLTKDELPEQARERMGQMFERLGKDSLTREDFQKMAERGGPGSGRPGEGRPGGDRFGPELLARLKQMDANKDGKVTLEEAPEDAKERIKQMLERTGRDAIDLEQMARMIEQGGPRRPEGPDGERRRPEAEGGERPRPEAAREGDRPRPEGERPEGDRPRPETREGDRPRPEGERPDGDRPRPEGREGDRPRPEGDRPRPDGERPEGDRPRPDGERPPMPRDGEGRPREGFGPGGPGGFGGPAIVRILDANRDGRLSREEFMSLGEKFKELDRNEDGELDRTEIFGPGVPGGPGMPRDGEGRPPEGFRPPRDGEGRPPEGFRPRDGEGRPPEGARPPRDGERGPPEGDRPPREGGDRPRPERPESDA